MLLAHSPRRNSRLGRLLAALGTAAYSSHASAADYYWTDFGQTETWDLIATNWSAGNTVAPWNNAGGDGAIFSAIGAGPVAVSSSGITAQRLLFTSNGYMLNGKHVQIVKNHFYPSIEKTPGTST